MCIASHRHSTNSHPRSCGRHLWRPAVHDTLYTQCPARATAHTLPTRGPPGLSLSLASRATHTQVAARTHQLRDTTRHGRTHAVTPRLAWPPSTAYGPPQLGLSTAKQKHYNYLATPLIVCKRRVPVGRIEAEQRHLRGAQPERLEEATVGVGDVDAYAVAEVGRDGGGAT